MLRCMKRVCGFAVQAEEGGIGKVHDLYFDDQSWDIRYLVVETGDWLLRRKVLLSPAVIDQPDWDAGLLHMHLTQAQVEHGPGIDTDKPVSRQHKPDLYHYFAWPPYWSAPGSIPVIAPILETGEEALESHLHDPHLRSLREVIGYHLQAFDDELGHVEDFVASDAAWSIAYVLIDTRNLLPGRRVLVPPAWVDDISWADRKVSVKSPRDIIEYSPGVEVSTILSIDQEKIVYDYYEQMRPLLEG